MEECAARQAAALDARRKAVLDAGARAASESLLAIAEALAAVMSVAGVPLPASDVPQAVASLALTLIRTLAVHLTPTPTPTPTLAINLALMLTLTLTPTLTLALPLP